MAMRKAQQLFRRTAKAVPQILPRDHGSQWHYSARQSLSAAQNIRSHVECLRRKHRTRFPVAGDHFVEDQHHVVLVADFPDDAKVFRRWHDNSACVSDWFEQTAGYRIGVFM